MQNFGNYNINTNTPIYVREREKKNAQKQNKDKSLGEKVAIGVASTAGVIAAILAGYGIINKRAGNITKVTTTTAQATDIKPEKVIEPANGNFKLLSTLITKIKDGENITLQEVQNAQTYLESKKEKALYKIFFPFLTKLLKKCQNTQYNQGISVDDDIKNKYQDLLNLNEDTIAELDEQDASSQPLPESSEAIILPSEDSNDNDSIARDGDSSGIEDDDISVVEDDNGNVVEGDDISVVEGDNSSVAGNGDDSVVEGDNSSVVGGDDDSVVEGDNSSVVGGDDDSVVEGNEVDDFFNSNNKSDESLHDLDLDDLNYEVTDPEESKVEEPNPEEPKEEPKVEEPIEETIAEPKAETGPKVIKKVEPSIITNVDDIEKFADPKVTTKKINVGSTQTTVYYITDTVNGQKIKVNITDLIGKPEKLALLISNKNFATIVEDLKLLILVKIFNSGLFEDAEYKESEEPLTSVFVEKIINLSAEYKNNRSFILKLIYSVKNDKIYLSIIAKLAKQDKIGILRDVLLDSNSQARFFDDDNLTDIGKALINHIKNFIINLKECKNREGQTISAEQRKVSSLKNFITTVYQQSHLAKEQKDAIIDELTQKADDKNISLDVISCALVEMVGVDSHQDSLTEAEEQLMKLIAQRVSAVQDVKPATKGLLIANILKKIKNFNENSLGAVLIEKLKRILMKKRFTGHCHIWLPPTTPTLCVRLVML